MKRRQQATGNPLVPERIDRYDVLLPIASGGMATVYLARTRGVGGFEREVALKVMHAHLREEPEFERDLVEEAKLAVRIQHPNVVRVQDVGDDPHGVFLVMDYVEGDSLAGLLRRVHDRDETIPERIGLRILYDALLGLHAAHELKAKDGSLVGLVHRDFSPQNILVGLDGVGKLTDFGVAKASTRLSHTATGLVKGKIHYMSPEQARTDPIDRRCDVWAAGVMAWEILAKRRLYKERNEASILLQLITEPPPRLRTVAPKVPQALENVVAHALTTDVSVRCPTAEALARGLEEGTHAYGGLASHAEVSAFVRALAGGNLGTRREQASKVLALRKSISNIAKEATIETDATPSSYGGHASQPGESEAMSEAMSAASQEVSTVEMPASGHPVPYQEPEVTSTSQAVPVRPPKRRSRIALLAAAAVLVGAVAAWATVGGDETGDSVAGDAADDEPNATASPTAAAAAPAPPDTSTSADPPIEPLTLKVAANAEVADLAIGERAVALDPAKDFELELRPGERDGEQRIRAISVDGRRSETTYEPGATTLTLTFPPKAGAAPVPRPFAHPVPRPKPKGAPLAPNPFDN